MSHAFAIEAHVSAAEQLRADELRARRVGERWHVRVPGMFINHSTFHMQPSAWPYTGAQNGTPPAPDTPLTLLTNVLIWIRPDFDQVVFNGGDAAEILNRGTLGGSADAPAAINEPLWNATDANFNNQPSVTLNGTSDYYNLPDLSALTEGEAFIVGRKALDPPVDAAKSGLWRIYTSGIDSHIPYPDGIIYDSFGMTASFRTVGDPAPSLASAFLYNARSAAGAWSGHVNGVQLATFGANTVGFNSDPRFGKSVNNYFYDGEIAELVICGTVQTAPARAAYLAYLSRFGLSL